MYTTLNDAWRVYKSRMKKKYYSSFENYNERVKNRPDDIPSEDFENLLKYWDDEAVKVL